jgi:hypothetical protein
MESKSYRDQEWLENLLADVWFRHFEDVPQTNRVIIKWGRKARRRLGSIAQDPRDQKTSLITINRLFQDLIVPEYVIRATIVHEMTHYAHGFNSPLTQRQRHPHSGGVILREFKERGLEDLYRQQKKWLKENWQTMVDGNFPINTRYVVARKTMSRSVPLPWWMRGI